MLYFRYAAKCSNVATLINISLSLVEIRPDKDASRVKNTMRDVPGRLQCMDLVTENKTKWQQEQMLPQPPADLGFLFLRTFPDRDVRENMTF